jgi:hypothetical protein
MASRPAASGPMSEAVLFQDALVTVSNARMIVRQKTTYAMANITSVREFVEPKPIGVLLCGFLLLVSGFACARQADIPGGWVVCLLGLTMVVWFLVMKPKHWVRIATSGSEVNAVWSTNPQWTKRVVEAINAAMIARG